MSDRLTFGTSLPDWKSFADVAKHARRTTYVSPDKWSDAPPWGPTLRRFCAPDETTCHRRRREWSRHRQEPKTASAARQPRTVAQPGAEHRGTVELVYNQRQCRKPRIAGRAEDRHLAVGPRLAQVCNPLHDGGCLGGDVFCGGGDRVDVRVTGQTPLPGQHGARPYVPTFTGNARGTMHRQFCGTCTTGQISRPDRTRRGATLTSSQCGGSLTDWIGRAVWAKKARTVTKPAIAQMLMDLRPSVGKTAMAI